MGIRYEAKNANLLISTVDNNIKDAKDKINQLDKGIDQLISSLDRKELEGAAYTAGNGLFRELVIPTVRRTLGAFENIEKSVRKFESENDNVKSYGILDEDKLKRKLDLLENMKDSIYDSIKVISGCDDEIFGLSIKKHKASMIKGLKQMIGDIDEDIEKIKEKLRKLRDFDDNTKSFFKDELEDLIISVQSLVALNEINPSIDSKKGTYSMPKGIKKDWFNEVQPESEIDVDNEIRTTVNEQKLHDNVVKYNEKVDDKQSSYTKKIVKAETKASVHKIKNGTWWRKPVKSTKTGRKTWKQVNGDVNRFKCVKNAKSSAAKAGKILKPVGVVLDFGTTYLERKNKYGEKKAAIDGAAHAGIALGCAELGAIVGSYIPIPVVGTVAGAALGAWLGSNVIEKYDEAVNRK